MKTTETPKTTAHTEKHGPARYFDDLTYDERIEAIKLQPHLANATMNDLREQRGDLLEALQDLVRDVECYCADNVAAKGLCGHCKAKDVLSRATGGQGWGEI